MSINKNAKFTAVIAVYNNEQYAEDLYRSIDRQLASYSDFEVVLVDDGSTDSSLALALKWQQKSDVDIRVVAQENSGVSSARNLGISNSLGEWITFVDSDDILHPKYFFSLAEFLSRDTYASASMLTTRSVIFHEGKGTTVDNHPLSWKYKRGDRLVSLTKEPHVVHLGGHSTVVKRQVVVEADLRFNDDVKPGFEDADFNGRYLAQFDEPILGLVASARYFYRKRANGSSLIDTTWTKPEKFTHEPTFGHLGMLKSITETRGYTPVWAQNTVLYSLYWYFLADRSWNSPIASVDTHILDEFWVTLHKIFRYIDVETIRKFSLRNYGWYLSEGVLRQFKDVSIVASDTPIVYKWGVPDRKNGTQKYVYSFLGEQPKEQFRVNGRRVRSLNAKSIANYSFGHVLMYERVLFVAAKPGMEIRLNGQIAKIAKMPSFNRLPRFDKNPEPYLNLARGREKISPQQRVSSLRKSNKSPLALLIGGALALFEKSREEAWVNNTHVFTSGFQIVSRVAKRRGSKKALSLQASRDAKFVDTAKNAREFAKYDDAWIFIDRTDRGDDNAEHLYRYVLLNHPEINAWFMIERNSRDWTRLASDGFKMIPYGEDVAVAPVLRAKFILSSHMDSGIFDLVDRIRFGGSPARRVFLQHGMNMNDISKWLNTKQLPLVIASSRPELEAFVADKGPYRITRSEVKLTGLPRHDQLIAKAKSHKKNGRSVVMIAPTWRKDLATQLESASSDEERSSILISSRFYEEWARVIESTTLRSAVDEGGLEIVFALHDHLSDFAELFSFSGKISVVPYSGMSVQDMLVRSRLVITDYSSLSTEASIAGAAVMYHQFDIASIYNGSHSFRKDWFDYSRDGFGPVSYTISDFERNLALLVANKWKSSRLYKSRLRRTIPFLDGKSCARVVREVKAL